MKLLIWALGFPLVTAICSVLNMGWPSSPANEARFDADVLAFSAFVKLTVWIAGCVYFARTP